MESPEQQPISEPEKNSADKGLDIDAAKKYLEEVYGGGKSSIIVDQSIPISEKMVDESVSAGKEPEVKESKPSIETERKDLNGTGEEEPKAKPSMIERLTEYQREEKKKQEAQVEAAVEAAKEELIELAKNINEATKSKDAEKEKSLLEKAGECFRVTTGDNLEEKARERAEVELRNEGLRLFATPEEYRKSKTAKKQERIRQRERSAIIRERWDMMTYEEKAEYFDEGKDKNAQENINSAIMKFATELRGKIEAQRQELSKSKRGIVISEDVFYELMRRGLKAENIKKRGFFGRMFGDEIEIPLLAKRDSQELTRDDLIAMEAQIKKRIENAAQEEIEREIIKGQRIWGGRKQRHKREIIQETAVKYEAEKKLEAKPEPEPETEPETEHSSKKTEELKTFEKIGDIEKLISKASKELRKIEELMKKKKQGKTLTKTDIAFLNRVYSGYKKKAEE